MPLTSKGEKILSNMEKEYGPKHGEQVFYASKNAGKISGIDAAKNAMDSAQNPTYRVDKGVIRNFNEMCGNSNKG
jgi:hypothetical protein